MTRGEIHRVAQGIYARLAEDSILGPLKPSTEEIAEAISRRDKARIIPTGSLALNALGLSTQIPINVVYYTDGSARKIEIGNRTVKFKKTAPKNGSRPKPGDYALICVNRKRKKATFLTPLNCALNALIFALNDSAEALVDRLSK